MIVSDIFHYQGRLFWRDLNFEKKNNKYNRIRAYTQSKMANIMHARELANRLEGSGIKVVSLHPGKRIPSSRKVVDFLGKNSKLFISFENG